MIHEKSRYNGSRHTAAWRIEPEGAACDSARVKLHGCNLFFLILINPFQPSVAFHIEICSANQMTGFWWNATLGGYGLRFSILLKLRSRIIYNTLLSRIYQENYFWQQEMAKSGMLLETGFWTGVKNSCEKCDLFTCQSLCGILCWMEL